MLTNANKVLKLLSPSKKLGRVAVAYLYSGGHILIRYERWNPRTEQDVNVVKVVRLEGVEMHFKGRVIVRSYGGVGHLKAAIASGLKYVSASVPSVERGSEASKKLGLKVGYVTFGTKLAGDLEHQSVSCIHDGFTYDDGQRATEETWKELTSVDKWAGYPIVDKIDLRPAVPHAA